MLFDDLRDELDPSSFVQPFRLYNSSLGKKEAMAAILGESSNTKNFCKSVKCFELRSKAVPSILSNKGGLTFPSDLLSPASFPHLAS